MEPIERIEEDLLVAKAQTGDEAAFERLFLKYHPRLLYYVRKLLKRKDLAEDVIQDVWLTIYRKLPSLRANRAFSVWIYRIAYTEAIKNVRTESRYVELPQGYDAEDANSSRDDDFHDAQVELLNIALERVGHPFREVIVLRLIEEMPYEEIAHVTGIPVGTVRSRIHYAKQALRKEMEYLKNERER